MVFLLMIGWNCAYAEIPNPKYLDVYIHSENGSGQSEENASLTCTIRPFSNCNGAYYVSDSGSGILSDFASEAKLKDAKFTLMFFLSVLTEGEKLKLMGFTIAMQYKAGNPTGEVNRTSIDRLVSIGEPVEFMAGKLADGRVISFRVTALESAPDESKRMGDNAITLISTQLLKGREYSKARSAHRLLVDKTNFSNGFILPFDKDTAASLRYDVEIAMPGAVQAISKAVSSQLTFSRSYAITYMKPDGTRMKAAVSYSSQYVKDLVLEPGKEIRLVFPPENPSVGGFDVEDTLIIVPR
jgi:hypothetical protein